MTKLLNRLSVVTWILIGSIVIGLICGISLVRERHRIEVTQERVENIIDYDAMVRANSYEKRSFTEALQAVKDSGITAFAIYDRTLQKAKDSGQIQLLASHEVGHIDNLSQPIKAGMTYIAPVSGKEAYFEEIQDDIQRRLGKDKVQIIQSTMGPLLGIMLPSDSLQDMNLGISRLQAKEVEQLGFHIIVRPTNYKDVTEDDVKHVFDRLEGIQGITGMVFVGKEILGYPNHLESTEKELTSRHIPLVGIEAVNQLQYFPQQGLLDIAKAHDYSVGRLYTVSKEELRKLTPQEITQWFYISDIERNIRYNLFPIYEQGVDNRTALDTTLWVANTVSKRLEARGFTLGEPSVYPAYTPNQWLMMGTMIGVISLTILTVGQFFTLRSMTKLMAFLLLVAISIGGLYTSKSTTILSIWALCAAIGAPVLAMTLVMDCWKSRGSIDVSPWKATGEAIVYLVVAAFIAAIGGISIASLLGSTEFFMEFALFRGVKLTFVAPVALTAIAYLQRFPIWKGRKLTSISDMQSFVKEFMQIDIKMYTLCIVALLGFVGYVFVGRSGHTAGVPVPSFELALRRFLENTMYARPREKEFIIGHPAFMLAAYTIGQRVPMLLHFAFTVAGVIGIGSMVETFCHLRTPVYMSIARGYDGVLLGILVGLIAIIGFRFLSYGIRWFQRRGDGHE